MEKLGFVQGRFSPCLWYKDCPQYGRLRVMVHGDDFIISATRTAIKWLHNEIGKSLISKLRGILGPDKSQGDIEDIVVLNRILGWIPGDRSTPDCITIEADPRHAALVVEHLHLTGRETKGVTSPGEKRKPDDEVPEDVSQPLDSSQGTNYRSIVMRGAYMSEDRPDIRYACKELARRMQAPT